MKFSVFTASTPDWTPAEAATTLAAQGWDGVEWRITDQPDSDAVGFWAGNRCTWPLTGLEDNLERIAQITSDSGLEYSGLGCYVRCSEHANAERVLAATATLGARQVRITVPGVEQGQTYPEVFDAARKDFSWVADCAASYGVKALVELHHRTLTASASAALRLVDGLDPDAIGVIHDLGNLVIEGQEDHSWAFQLLGPYLAHIHVKNAAWTPTGSSADGTVTWQNSWATLRAGQADVGAYLKAVAAHGYDGWVTVEDFSTELPLASRTEDNLAYLKSFVGG